MATKKLSVTEARNLARVSVLDAIKGTNDTPTKIYYKGITVESLIPKGGATLEILSQDRERTLTRIIDYFKNPRVSVVDDNHYFVAVRSSDTFYKSITDAVIINIIPTISRIPILTVLLYSRKYNQSLQKYLDDPNPLSNQIEKDLDLALNHLFDSKVYSKLTEPFKSILNESPSGRSTHTGYRNEKRNVTFNGKISLSSLNTTISDVQFTSSGRSYYVSVKYSSGRGKRFFILSTTALSKYFYGPSENIEDRTSILEYFGLDGQKVYSFNGLKNNSTIKTVNVSNDVLDNLNDLIANSLGKDIYLYHWTRLKGPNLDYFDKSGPDVNILGIPDYRYDDSQRLARIVADSVSINNRIYKAEFEFKFKTNDMEFNIFLTSKA